MGFGQIVLKALKKQSLTRKAVCAESGLSESMLGAFLRGEKSLSIDRFSKVCTALGMDIKAFVERGGRPEVIGDTDMRAITEEYLGQATPTELMEIRILAAEHMPWPEIWRTRDVRNKALESEHTSEVLKDLARNESLWFDLRPTGAEVQTLEASAGKYETTEDYMSALFALRRKERKAAAAAVAAQARPMEKAKKKQRKNRQKTDKKHDSVVEVPIYGDIAAGHPIEAIQDQHGTVRVDAHMVRDPETAFALRVQGDSMIDEGINDGDFIIVDPRDTADPGQTVVALIDEEKATVKKFWPEGRNVKLKPCNPDHVPLLLQGNRVRIQGIVVGLVRDY